MLKSYLCLILIYNVLMLFIWILCAFCQAWVKGGKAFIMLSLLFSNKVFVEARFFMSKCLYNYLVYSFLSYAFICISFLYNMLLVRLLWHRHLMDLHVWEMPCHNLCLWLEGPKHHIKYTNNSILLPFDCLFI